MKRCALILNLCLLVPIAVGATAQTIIENPAKPDNPRAGRVVTLEEVMRIEDTGKDFYIKAVYGLQVAGDGSVFVQDEQKQLLRFDANGRYMGSLLKKGEGPGELVSLSGFLAAGDAVFLYGTPRKVITLDFAGGLRHELALPRTINGPVRLLATTPSTLLFTRSGRPDPKAGVGWTGVPQELVAVSRADGTTETLANFPIPAYVQALSNGGTSLQTFGALEACALDEATYGIVHAAEYLIEVFDLKTRKVTAAFKRPYKRVKAQRTGGISGTAGATVKSAELWNDIIELHAVDGRIWVKTSTADPQKGILFDVYDREGRYLDCFHLKFKAEDILPVDIYKPFVFAGGFVYFGDKTEEETVVIRKCRLVGL